jgi:hypothetical protein
MRYDLGIIKPTETENHIKFDDLLVHLLEVGLSIAMIDINSFDSYKMDVKVRDIKTRNSIKIGLSEFSAVHAYDFELSDEFTMNLNDKWKKVFQFYSALHQAGVCLLNSFHSFVFFNRKDYLFDCFKFMPNNVIPTFSSFAKASNHFKDIVSKPINGECSIGVTYDVLNSKSNITENLIYQPNMSIGNILEEYSLLYFDNVCVNGVQKRFKWDDNEKKLQNIETSSYDFSEEEVTLGLKFMNHLDEKVRPKIWRFDFIKKDKEVLLMELEAVDPYHYDDFASKEYWNTLENLYKKVI